MTVSNIAPRCGRRQGKKPAGRRRSASSSPPSKAKCSCRHRSRRPLEPRQVGPLFEIRQYTLVPGAIPGLIERWTDKIEGRTKFSPLVGGWYSEFGALNKWVHIWAYKDANERFSVRAAAAATGQWPARNPPGIVVKQENALVMPSAFSPIR